jgi:hypothetical protein
MKDADAVEAGLNSVDPFTAEPEPELGLSDYAAMTTPELLSLANSDYDLDVSAKFARTRIIDAIFYHESAIIEHQRNGAAMAPRKPLKLTATADEGALLTDDQEATVRGHYASLTPNQRSYVAAIATDAHRGGAGLDMKIHPATHRRGFLVTALSKFAAEYVTDNADLDEADTMFRAVLALVVDGLAWSKHSIGAIVATLTAEQAQALSGVVNAVINQLFEMSFSDDGRPHFNQITPQLAA